METYASPTIVNDVFNDFDRRTSQAINQIKEGQKQLNEHFKIVEEKNKKIIEFLEFRNKIAKIESAYSIMISQEEMKEISKSTYSVKDELWKNALRLSNGDEKKAISLIFSSSDDVLCDID